MNSDHYQGRIDINCDLGEGYGAYTLGDEAAVLPYITSASIACGFHAGDPAVMRRTVRRCLEHGVAVGAHPGLPDRQGFGRREMRITADEAYELTLYQIGALDAFLRAEGERLRHVKPHGALYNMAAKDLELALAIAAAVRRYSPALKLYGLAGSSLIQAGEHYGLETVSEVFADRRYQADCSLVPRTEANAVIDNEAVAVAQVLQIASTGMATSWDGAVVRLAGQTVCIHGDNPRSVALAASLRPALERARIEVAAP